MLLASIAAFVLASPPQVGLKIGDTVSAYEPHHVSGPDANTETCPVCKYVNRPMVQVWTRRDAPDNTLAIAKVLDSSVNTYRKKEFKAFVVNLAPASKIQETNKALASLSRKLPSANVALTSLPETSDAVALYDFPLRDDVKNVIYVYVKRRVTAKFVNFSAKPESVAALKKAIAQAAK